MYKVGHTLALLGAFLPFSTLAQSVNGVIKNEDGAGIAGARVQLEGTSLVTVTNQNGQFNLTGVNQGQHELHISAAGFAHLNENISVLDTQASTITLQLARSPIEVIDVVSTPIHMSVMESAAPVSVLSGEQLRRQQAATLGDSLESLPGVNTNFHGNVASTPIIRGLSGARVLIAQNGLDVSDVSRVGPDHSVASEASTATQIEVLRGPATLFYGSGAVGGVVNVVDGRVPTDNETRGEWQLQNSSVNDENSASFNFTSGLDAVAVYADAFWRESNDYQIPVNPHSDEQTDSSVDYVVDNSAEKSNGFTLGTSYLFDQGYLGIAVEDFNREYGVPGHSHGDESVYADLDQTRIQLLSEVNIEGKWLKKVNLRVGHTDYQHKEVEGGETGTLFENTTQEFKLDVLHSHFYDWHGGISFHYKNSDVAAQGEEAFTPPADSRTFALALMEEKHFGSVLLQLGARIEQVNISADAVLLPSIEAGDEQEHDHDHDHDDASITQVFSVDHEFTPLSLSAGLVWDFLPRYNIGVSVSRSERAPSAAELLSFGPHIGTGNYEVGALFALTPDDDEAAIGLSQAAIDLETANNIDITLRKTQGDFGFVFNAFYNQIDNYYYQTSTGLFIESSHDHDHSEHEHSESEEETDLPVYLFETADVVLHGFELNASWQVSNEFKASLFSDYVRARLQDGGNLPRTPPMRFGTQLSYQNERLHAHLDVIRYQQQDKVAADESQTAGYTLVNMSMGYDIAVLNQDITLYLKGENLSDTEARVHSSFIKDIAPRPGRNFSVGVRGTF